MPKTTLPEAHSTRLIFFITRLDLVINVNANNIKSNNILTTVITNIVVDKSTDNAEALSICFLPQYERQRKFLSQSVTKIITEERANVVYNCLAIRLVYFPKWVFLIGYYIA